MLIPWYILIRLQNLKKGLGPDVIVATPGRLLMHLEETRSFAERCRQTSCLILDEADRLLDMGFKADIDKIASYLRKDASGVSLLDFFS